MTPEDRLVECFDQALRQWEMYVTEAAQDDLEDIDHAEADELRRCKKALAEYMASKGKQVERSADEQAEIQKIIDSSPFDKCSILHADYVSKKIAELDNKGKAREYWVNDNAEGDGTFSVSRTPWYGYIKVREVID